MTQFNQNHEPVDPQLIELLEQLRPAPPRDPEAQAAGRAKFLAEVESIPRTQLAHRSRLSGWFSLNHKYKEEFNMNRKRRFAFSVLLAFILGFVFLLGGAGATVLAAQSALPGDALYPVKTGLEQTQVSMAGDAYNQAQLHLEFAQRRLDEIDRLIADGRFRDVSQAAEAFEVYLQKAIAAFQVVAQDDPARSAELAGQVADALSQYAQVLNALAANAPEAVRPEVERALQAALNSGQFEAGAVVEVEFTGVVERITSQMWKIAGRQVAIAPHTEIKDSLTVGDLVKVHAQMIDAETLVAREIVLATANANENEDDLGDQNANVNEANDNQNGNFNANLNDNSNLNGGLLNENANANDNLNDNINENANDNRNDNSNMNDDDNQNDDSNVNAGDDSNDNGSVSNDNVNANQNSNDNGDDSSGSGSNDNDDGDDNSGSGSGGDDNHNGDGSGGGNDNEDDDDY